MRYCSIICVILILLGCNQYDDLVLHNDIREYQGIWRDTIYANGEAYVEDVIVKEENIEYTLTNINTHIICDKLIGTIIIGNENIIGWNCESSITKSHSQTYWDVLALSQYKIILYSILLGEHVFLKKDTSLIDEYETRDTMDEILSFKKYLPRTKDSLTKEYGIYERQTDDKGLTYLLNHPLFNKIRFDENYDNDSIYSYTLFMSDWNNNDSLINSRYTMIRDVNGKKEYCDGENFTNSSHIIMTDSVAKQISFIALKDYNYWPNISHFIGKSIQDVKNVFSKKYIYEYDENYENGEHYYSYKTGKDSVFTFIQFVTDSLGIISSCGIEIFDIIIGKTDAQKKCAEIASLFNRKYHLVGFDQESETGTYYYSSDKDATKSNYNIRLFYKFYQKGQTYYRIQIHFDKVQ